MDGYSQSKTRVQTRNNDEEIDIDGVMEFFVERYGSVMKAWRRAIDPNRDGELLYTDFIEALSRASWEGDTAALWRSLETRARANGRTEFATVSLQEFSQDDYLTVDHFRSWTLNAFGGPVDMFNAMSKSNAGKPNAGTVCFEDFKDTCLKHGFDGDIAGVFYGALDLDGVGSIVIDDIAFIEPCGVKRRRALDPLFVVAVENARATAERMQQRVNQQRHMQSTALQEFRHRVKAANGGSFARGWRRTIATTGGLTVSKTDLRMGCKKLAFSSDVAALWRALDLDDDGSVHLQEVDLPMALLMARFRKWAVETYGSCVGLMRGLATSMKKRSPKWSLEEFMRGLQRADFPEVVPGISLRQAVSLLHASFDLDDVGFFVAQDLEFLDKWEPAPYLTAQADEQEKIRFLSVLRSKYPSIIVAWRRFLDKNNTNCVSYKEFCEGCKFLKQEKEKPNLPGLWCSLDKDVSGFISLDEVDPHSFDSLKAFKVWAEKLFGTITCAFKMMDGTHTGAIPFQVFKRSLKDFGSDCDAKALFQLLKPESKNCSRDVRLTLEDIKYLSSWEIADTDEPAAEADDEVELDPMVTKALSPKAPRLNKTASAPAFHLSAPLESVVEGVQLPRSIPNLAGNSQSSSMLPGSRNTRPATSANEKISFPRLLSPAFTFCKSTDEVEHFVITKRNLENSLPMCTFKISECLSRPQSSKSRPLSSKSIPHREPFGSSLASTKLSRARKKSPYELGVCLSFPAVSKSDTI